VPTPRSPSSATAAPSPAAAPTTRPAVFDAAQLPDDTVLLKQLIAELLAALRRDRRELAEVQQRLDALLQKGRRPEPVNPNQPLLFPELAEPEPAPPAPAAEPPTKRRGQSKPHGRRRPSPTLRREPRRYELTRVERLCPECGLERQEIGVEVTGQLDYKPAEVFVVEHQRVKYACKQCAGHVVLAPKPKPPLERALPGPGLLAQIVTDKYDDVRLDGVMCRAVDAAVASAEALGVAIEGAAHRRHHRAGA
jgi:hypothetical protein